MISILSFQKTYRIRKNQHQFLKHLKKMIKKFDFSNIIKTNASTCYYLI